ncbi:MAG: tRNA (adenosine(37)-N6)-threonylcarbamoyltransferase complex ATPase subunit type 1 TsaE [Patescibacteria group bacterium]
MELSLEELADFAKKFVADLPRVSGSRAHVAGLTGPLGAGKTTFVQLVARELGIKSPVTSPTFVFVKTYPVSRPPFTRLVHVDGYRLAPDDRDTAGFGEHLEDPGNLVLAEWPENIPGFPPDAPILVFRVTGETTRSVDHHAKD